MRKEPEAGLRALIHTTTTDTPASNRSFQQEIGIMSAFPWGERPNYPSAEDWYAHVKSCEVSGARPWHPVTRSELELAEELGLLRVHREWIPGRQGLRLLGLPDYFGRRLPPFSLRWQERAIQTLIDYPETLAALRSLVMREQSV